MAQIITLSDDALKPAHGENAAAGTAGSQVRGAGLLSLHSGSDKFSIYGIAADVMGGLVHLKTSGTSYIEALRAAAAVPPPAAPSRV